MVIVSITIFLILHAVLATYVLIHATNRLRATLFAVLVALFAFLNAQTLFPYIASNPDQMYLLRVIHALALGSLGMVMLLLLSHMFVPAWWQGRRPVIWISMPYLLILLVFALDLVGRSGIFVNGLNADTRHSLRTVNSGSRLLIGSFALGWLVQVVMLLRATTTNQKLRRPGILIIVSMAITMVIAILNGWFKLIPSELTAYTSSIPMLITLAYIVLRMRMFGPTATALSMALRSLSDAVLVLDQQQRVVYQNARAQQLGFGPGTPFTQQLRSISQHNNEVQHITEAVDAGRQTDLPVLFHSQQFMLSLSPVTDRRGTRQGTLVIGRDVTEWNARTTELEQQTIEQQRLIDLVATLEAPIMTLDDGVLIAPIVGHVNQQRAATLTSRLLHAAHTQRARAVILDITGVAEADVGVAQVLTQANNTLRLLGCLVIVSGISADMAATLIKQNIRMENMLTVRSPQEALKLQLLN